MNRRKFITSVAALSAVPARAQGRTFTVGFLHSGTNANINMTPHFLRGLRDAGFVEGRNLAIEYRWGDDQPERLPALAVELAEKPVDAIFTIGGVTPTRAAMQATSRIPIVFVHGADRPDLLRTIPKMSGP